MYNYAHHRIHEYRPTTVSDSRLYFYVPSSYTGAQVEITLRVSQPASPLDSIDMKYKLKQFQPSELVSNGETRLLRTSIDQMLTELAIAEIAQEDIKVVPTPRKQSQMLTQKYIPKLFSELLSDEKINREVLTWLKAWDQTQHKGQAMNFLFKRMMPNVIENSAYLANQIVLLAGPPGTGKTTLARVIAGACGYQCIEVNHQINASDMRTSDSLIERIETMCNNHNLGTSKTLVVLDEVDGALESESQGAIDKLLEYIYSGKKTAKPAGKGAKTKQRQKPNEEQEDKIELPMASTSTLHIKRPVIFICNDPYAKGLRELRKKVFDVTLLKALVYHFKRNQDDRLVQRLKFICKREQIKIDQSTLQKLCSINDFDIRACLGALEMFAIGEVNQMQSLQSTKTIYQLMEEVFYQQGSTSHISALMTNLTKSVESSLLLQATFANYLQIKSVPKKMEIVPNFLNLMCLSDMFERQKLRLQFELTRFITLPHLYFHLKMRSHDRSQLTYPMQQFEFRRMKLKKQCEDIIHSLLQQCTDTGMRNRNNFALMVPSYLYQLIQPRTELSIMTPVERKDILTSLAIMHAFKITITHAPVSVTLGENRFLEVNFNPQIERLLSYSGMVMAKSINEKSRMIMMNLYPLVSRSQQAGDAGRKAKKAQQDIDYLDRYDTMARKTKRPQEQAKLIFRYQEGQSTPIVYQLKMEYFFK